MWPFSRAPRRQSAAAKPEPYKLALTDLTRSARKALIADRQARVTADLRRGISAGKIAPIPPRDQVVAGIRQHKGE